MRMRGGREADLDRWSVEGHMFVSHSLAVISPPVTFSLTVHCVDSFPFTAYISAYQILAYSQSHAPALFHSKLNNGHPSFSLSPPKPDALQFCFTIVFLFQIASFSILRLLHWQLEGQMPHLTSHNVESACKVSTANCHNFGMATSIWEPFAGNPGQDSEFHIVSKIMDDNGIFSANIHNR